MTRTPTRSRRQARSLGYAVSFEATPAGVGGWCDRNKRIVVDASAPANGRLRKSDADAARSTSGR